MKFYLATVAILLFGASVISASEIPSVDPKVVSRFEKDFSFATNAKWLKKEDLFQVSFLINEQSVTAWYNPDAELVVIARNMLYSQLPISVTRALDKNYAGADFYNIIEVTHNGVLHYQVTAETMKKSVVLKVTPSGNIDVKKRIK